MRLPLFIWANELVDKHKQSFSKTGKSLSGFSGFCGGDFLEPFGFEIHCSCFCLCSNSLATALVDFLGGRQCLGIFGSS